MSSNTKNVVRNAYMSNFTTDKKHRYIITEKGSDLDTYIQKNLNSINEAINISIQELSIKITNRQLPYIIIEKLPVDFSNIQISQEDKRRRIRGFIRDLRTNIVSLKKFDDDESISHSIEFFTNTTYQALTFSNLDFDAKILMSKDGLQNVFMDIFLDSAMFNSYSFLKGMSTLDKHEFGKKKFEYFKNKNLPCFYRIDTEDIDQIFYYSLAFSCRTSDNEFDYDMYIKLWDDFIAECYPNEKHIEKSISEQLQMYIDAEQLPKNLKTKFVRKKEGAYLILRINRNQTKSLEERINSYFGIDDFHIGEIKIKEISEYYNIQDMLRNLDVAAYKIVKAPNRKKK